MPTNREKSTNPVCQEMLLNSSQQLSHYYILITNVDENYFLQVFATSLSAVHLLWWFTVQVLTSALVSDLSNVAGHVSAEACTQVQLLYVMNPLI